MVKKKVEGIPSDIRYFTKAKIALINRGYPEADAEMQALSQALNRAKGIGAYLVYRKIADRILTKYNVDKSQWAGYYAFINKCVNKVMKGQFIDLVVEYKRFKDKGLEVGPLNAMYKLFGDFY